MPKYSFIVPVYNCGPYLMPCVQSLLNQTCQDFEILLVDDGTPDDGGLLCDQLAAQHPCIRTFHKENGGAASARNYGIDRAKGEYLLFIDGDDSLESNCLTRIDGILTSEKVEIVIFGMSFDYYSHDRLSRTEKLAYSHCGIMSTFEVSQNFRDVFHANALSSACNKCFRGDIIKANSIKFLDGMIVYEDFAFVLQYLKCVNRVFFLPDSMYHYRLNVQNEKIYNRIKDFHIVLNNLQTLKETACGFSDTYNVQSPISVVDCICIQLFYEYLMQENPGIIELREISNRINCFLTSELELPLTKTEDKIIWYVREGKNRKMLRWIRIRQRVRKMKKIVKQAYLCIKDDN